MSRTEERFVVLKCNAASRPVWITPIPAVIIQLHVIEGNVWQEMKGSSHQDFAQAYIASVGLHKNGTCTAAMRVFCTLLYS